MLLEKVCGMSRPNVTAKIYTSFPPSLSLPSLNTEYGKLFIIASVTSCQVWPWGSALVMWIQC
jgi:TorA maturation chaperone TorD